MNQALRHAVKQPAQGQPQDTGYVAAYLALLAKLRNAGDTAELRFVAVNDTRAILNFRQAFFLEKRGAKWRVACISSLPAFDRNAPMVRHMESVANRHIARGEMRQFDIEGLEQTVDAEGARNPFSKALFLPFPDRAGGCSAGLLCVRERAWRGEETPLFDEVAASIAHALVALQPARRRYRKWSPGRRIASAAIVVLVILALFAPVPLTALAPAEVVGADPSIIAAPIDGVIGDLPLPPNSKVDKGDLILSFVDIRLRNEAQLAARARAVAQAKLTRLVQVAFNSQKEARDIAVAQAELDLAEAEWMRASALLERSQVRAPVDGVLIYSAKTDWIGKPVATGERIMDIVDPARTQLRIDLPVADAIALSQDANIVFYPDGDPLASISARLARPGYRPMQVGDGKLAYRSYARFSSTDTRSNRIGIRGTAKIYGDTVRLGFYLVRRPVSALRQWAGL